MIEAGSIGIRAVWSDQEARQSADRFYADMKRKRDEAMTGSGASGATPAGRVDPGAWRTNPAGLIPTAGSGASAWRFTPFAGGGGRGAGGSDGAFMGGGFGGGGGGGGGGDIPEWLYGWRSPISPGGGGGGGAGGGTGGGAASQIARMIGRRLGLGNLGFSSGYSGVATVATAAFAGEMLLTQYTQARDRQLEERLHGPSAALAMDESNIRGTWGSTLGRPVRAIFSSRYEGAIEAIERAKASVQDVSAGRQRLAEQRETSAEAARFGQQGELAGTTHTFSRRMAEVRNAFDNLQMGLENRLAAMRDELAANDDPLAAGRLKAGISSTERGNTRLLDAAMRARAAEENQIVRDRAADAEHRTASAAAIRARRQQQDYLAGYFERAEMRNEAKRTLTGPALRAEMERIDELGKTDDRQRMQSRAVMQREVHAAQTELADRPLSAQAERIANRAQATAESRTDSELAKTDMKLGRIELQNYQKEVLRRGSAQEFNPRTAAFGVSATGGKESPGDLVATIKRLIEVMEKWTPDLK